MLEVKNICKTYTGRRGNTVKALSDVTFTLNAGDFVAVAGPSGCGKSTLLLLCGGLLSPTQGRVILDGTDMYSLPAKQLAGIRSRHIGFVFQQFHLIPYLSLRDNILTASIALPSTAPSSSADNTDSDNTRVDLLLEKFNLQHRADHLPSEVSIGERQRTALARAMLNEPEIILADEPTGNLDPDNSDIVLKTLAEFTESAGSVLMVTHDRTITSYATHLYRMQQGRITD